MIEELCRDVGQRLVEDMIISRREVTMEEKLDGDMVDAKTGG